MLQDSKQKGEDDTIIHLALNWFCDSQGESLNNASGVNTGVRLDLSPAVCDIPVLEQLVDLQSEGNASALPNAADMPNANFLHAANQLPSDTKTESFDVSNDLQAFSISKL